MYCTYQNGPINVYHLGYYLYYLWYIPCQRNEHARHLEQMQLDSMLLELPEKRRCAMFYRYTMGCNIAETARKMHLSEGTVS